MQQHDDGGQKRALIWAILYKTDSLREISDFQKLLGLAQRHSSLHERGFNRFVVMTSETDKWQCRKSVRTSRG
jgi:hypothetical protein